MGKGDGLGRVVATLLDDPFVGEEGREAGGVEWVKMLRRWCADGGESQGLLIRYCVHLFALPYSFCWLKFIHYSPSQVRPY